MASTVGIVARILRPSVLAMGRGPDVSAEAGRTLWPSAAEAVARHNAMKDESTRHFVSLADRGERRTGHAAKTTPSNGTGPFFFAVGWKQKTCEKL